MKGNPNQQPSEQPIHLNLRGASLLVYPAEVLELVGESPTLLRRAFERGKAAVDEQPAPDIQEAWETLLDRLELAREEGKVLRELLISRHGWEPATLEQTVGILVMENVQAAIDRLAEQRRTGS